jgi:hypothetical protein
MVCQHFFGTETSKDPDGGWKSHHSQQASTLDEEGACGQRVLTKEEPATKEKSHGGEIGWKSVRSSYEPSPKTSSVYHVMNITYIYLRIKHSNIYMYRRGEYRKNP